MFVRVYTIETEAREIDPAFFYNIILIDSESQSLSVHLSACPTAHLFNQLI